MGIRTVGNETGAGLVSRTREAREATAACETRISRWNVASRAIACPPKGPAAVAGHPSDVGSSSDAMPDRHPTNGPRGVRGRATLDR
jgi:hypothetical protein